MRSTIDRSDLGLIAITWLAAGLAFGRLERFASTSDVLLFPALAVLGASVLALFTLRRAWRTLPRPPREYRADPADIAHFTARQEDRARTIGHE